PVGFTPVDGRTGFGLLRAPAAATEGTRMLRITVQEEANSIGIVLEGRLAADWVDELRSVWIRLQQGGRQKLLVVTLTEMSGLDAAGHALLAEIHAAGGVLKGSGLAARDVIEKITGKPA